MKVKFKKDHLEFKKGDIADVTQERANYFNLTGVATTTRKDTNEEKEASAIEPLDSEAKEKKEDMAVTEKKTIEKPVTKKSK